MSGKKSRLLPRLLAVLFLAGCQTAIETQDVSSPDFRLSPRLAVEITPANMEFEHQRTQARRTGKALSPDGPVEGEIIELPKYVVTEKGFVKFGFSVVTNTEVKHGGRIKWMRVGLVIPGSPAARNNLDPWDTILAIDRVIVTDLDREGMLQALFQKHSGDGLTLHILSRRRGLFPTIVRLTDKAR